MLRTVIALFESVFFQVLRHLSVYSTFMAPFESASYSYCFIRDWFVQLLRHLRVVRTVIAFCRVFRPVEIITSIESVSYCYRVISECFFVQLWRHERVLYTGMASFKNVSYSASSESDSYSASFESVSYSYGVI